MMAALVDVKDAVAAVKGEVAAVKDGQSELKGEVAAVKDSQAKLEAAVLAGDDHSFVSPTGKQYELFVNDKINDLLQRGWR